MSAQDGPTTSRQTDPRQARGAAVWRRISGGRSYPGPDGLVELGDYETTREERLDLAHFMNTHSPKVTR